MKKSLETCTSCHVCLRTPIRVNINGNALFEAIMPNEGKMQKKILGMTKRCHHGQFDLQLVASPELQMSNHL